MQEYYDLARTFVIQLPCACKWWGSTTTDNAFVSVLGFFAVSSDMIDTFRWKYHHAFCE